MPSEELTLDSPLVTQANDIDAVPELIQQLQDGLVSLQSDDHDTRLDLLSKARSLVQALEAPRETMVKHCAAQVRPVLYATICCPLPTKPYASYTTDIDSSGVCFNPWC